MSEWALCALQCSGWSLMPANVQPAKAGHDCVWVYKKWNNTGHVTRELRRRGWSIESTRLLLTLRHRCLCSCGDKEGNVCPSARLWPAKTSSCWATLSAPGNSKLWMNVEKHRYKYRFKLVWYKTKAAATDRELITLRQAFLLNYLISDKHNLFIIMGEGPTVLTACSVNELEVLSYFKLIYSPIKI